MADGTVTLAFRRWERPTIKPGGTLQTPGGVLGIDEVDLIEPSDVSDEDELEFKPRVRRLKALGLTESLDVGYRLSPRGQAFLAEMDARTRGATGPQFTRPASEPQSSCP